MIKFAQRNHYAGVPIEQLFEVALQIYLLFSFFFLVCFKIQFI